MKIAICEDEPVWQKEIRQKTEAYYRSLDVLVLLFSSGRELLHAMEKESHPYDLIFMDIEMPGMDGLETSRVIRQKWADVPIIILTTHTEFAMAGYEVNAFRFLEKPVSLEKLYQALDGIEAIRQADSRIMITDGGREIYLPCRDIFWLRSENVYLRIMTASGSYLIREKLKERMAELPKEQFFQVYRSYIVNMSHITSFDGREAVLKDGTRIPVSRNRREAFGNAMFRFIRNSPF